MLTHALCYQQSMDWVFGHWYQWSSTDLRGATPKFSIGTENRIRLPVLRFKSRQHLHLDIYVINKDSRGGHSVGYFFMGDIKLMILCWPDVLLQMIPSPSCSMRRDMVWWSVAGRDLGGLFQEQYFYGSAYQCVPLSSPDWCNCGAQHCWHGWSGVLCCSKGSGRSQFCQ